MKSSESSTAAELDQLLGRLPVGAPIGIAGPDRAEAKSDEAGRGNADQHEANEIVLGIGLNTAQQQDVLSGLGPDATLIIDPPDGGTHMDERVVVKPAGISWRELHAALVQPRLQIDDDLADLAQTIATLTGGLVTIEDTASRVLAYSRSSDEVDELRRLSILGRSGPPEYLALLREWGIYDRLATSEEVVEIAEHPASGVRRRLAVGVFAGRRQLGTIWVQQGRSEFGPHAQAALLGAARLTAAELVGARPRPNRLGDLLSGRDPIYSLGADADRPAVVAALEVVPGEDDPATRQQKLDQLAAVATMHAAGLRRRSLTERIGDRIVILLPAMAEPAQAESMLQQAVAAAARVSGAEIRAGLGLAARSPRTAGTSLRQAELALRAPADTPVRRFDRVRNRLLTTVIDNYLDRQQDLLDPAVDQLVAEDPDSARTLLRYLDTGSDVSRVATEMAIHPTTVRYRLRRVAKAIDMDLANPDDRLSVQLQLRHGLARQK